MLVTTTLYCIFLVYTFDSYLCHSLQYLILIYTSWSFSYMCSLYELSKIFWNISQGINNVNEHFNAFKILCYLSRRKIFLLLFRIFSYIFLIYFIDCFVSKYTRLHHWVISWLILSYLKTLKCFTGTLIEILWRNKIGLYLIVEFMISAIKWHLICNLESFKNLW